MKVFYPGATAVGAVIIDGKLLARGEYEFPEPIAGTLLAHGLAERVVAIDVLEVGSSDEDLQENADIAISEFLAAGEALGREKTPPAEDNGSRRRFGRRQHKERKG
jgi:hypothetical protein